MFLVGGGGAADSQTAGASGFFKHETLVMNETLAFVLDVTIGGGNGETTTVRGLPFSTTFLSARGGGRGTAGWSGVSGDIGGSNGEYGSNEPLPHLCNVSLTPGAAGQSGDGAGAGGVVVDGRKPTRTSPKDGEGFGAGGGEDGRQGYPGVVVLTLCEH